MDRRFTVGLAIALVALALPAGAGAKQAPTFGSFAAASDLAPSKGGPAGDVRGYLPLNAAAFAAAKSRASTRANRPSGGGGSGGGGTPTISTYPGLVAPSFNGIYQTGLTPPDTTGTAGPDRYIETINTSYAIYNKTGSLINSGPLSALTGISTSIFGYSLSDPQMMWDAGSGRFYYTAVFYDAFLSNMGLAIGWSKTATPASSGDFCKYTIGFGDLLPDYPKLGDSKDLLMVGYNLFSNAATTYEDSEFAIVNKPAAGLACADPSQFSTSFSPALVNADSNHTPASTPVPARLVDDSNGTGYVIANADVSTMASANFATIWPVSTAPPDGSGIPKPTIGSPVLVTVDPYAMPANAHEAGSSYVLDTLDGRFEAATAATDPRLSAMALWTAHAVFGGAGAQERWYEINADTGALLQHNSVGTPTTYTWNGAISPDRAGSLFGDSMAMTFSQSSSTTYPAIQFVYQKGGGAQSAAKTLVQATTASTDFSCSQSGTNTCRWGDYSGASPDPSPPAGTVGRVWLANQYNVAAGRSSTSWRTWIFGVTPTG
jgi:hypothetical protein